MLSALSFCFGVLALTCQQPQAELAFAPGAQPIPHELTVESRSAQTSAFIAVTGATFAATPTISGATVVGSSPSAIQIAGPGALNVSGITLNVAGSDVGDEVTVYVRIADPNTATVLAEQTVKVASIRGVERFRVPFFNPAANRTQDTLLRLIADGGDVVAVITGRDDAGNRSAKGEFLVPAGTARQVSAAQLEAQIGQPVGKWRLVVDTDAPGLTVQGLVRNAQTGTITTITDTAN